MKSPWGPMDTGERRGSQSKERDPGRARPHVNRDDRSEEAGWTDVYDFYRFLVVWGRVW